MHRWGPQYILFHGSLKSGPSATWVCLAGIHNRPHAGVPGRRVGGLILDAAGRGRSVAVDGRLAADGENCSRSDADPTSGCHR